MAAYSIEVIKKKYVSTDHKKWQSLQNLATASLSSHIYNRFHQCPQTSHTTDRLFKNQIPTHHKIYGIMLPNAMIVLDSLKQQADLDMEQFLFITRKN
jgi:hypothetical protein